MTLNVALVAPAAMVTAVVTGTRPPLSVGHMTRHHIDGQARGAGLTPRCRWRLAQPLHNRGGRNPLIEIVAVSSARRVVAAVWSRMVVVTLLVPTTRFS